MIKYLIYADILGFKKLSEQIAKKSGFHEDGIRETIFSNPLRNVMGSLGDSLRISKGISSIEGSDNYVIAADSLDRSIEVIRKLTTIRIPAGNRKYIPLEIAIGTKNIDKIEVELKNRKEVIEFLKEDIITPYRRYIKSKGKKLRDTFILLTGDTFKELGRDNSKHCKKITFEGKTFYVAGLNLFQEACISASERVFPLLSLLQEGKVSQFNRRRRSIQPELIDFREVDISGLNLRNADLSNIYFIGAKLQGTDLTNAILDNTKLMEADLSNARLNGASLFGTQLQGASLTNAELNGAQIDSADLTRANLSSAKMRKSGIYYSSFFLANLNDANLSKSAAKETDFERASLQNANLSNVFFKRVDMSNTDLRRTNMRNAQIGFSYMNKADLREADLSDSALPDLDLSDADLRGAVLTNVNLKTTSHKRIKLSKSRGNKR